MLPAVHFGAWTDVVPDAILGLRELLNGYPTLIQTHLTSLVNNCTRLIADEVRGPLPRLFEWFYNENLL